VKLSRIAVGSAVTLSLVGGSLLATPEAYAQCVNPETGEPAAAVVITGGTITNETVIDITADAGTSISDASGGSNNLATTSGGGDGTDTASSGNGGVATSSANGGAVSIKDINSGGNAGNAISVGNTACAPFTPPAEEAPVEAPVVEEVVALPSTGVGAGEVSALFSLLAAAGAAATSLGLRRR
jgi:hypothetical protein